MQNVICETYVGGSKRWWSTIDGGRRRLLWLDDGCTNDHNDDMSKWKCHGWLDDNNTDNQMITFWIISPIFKKALKILSQYKSNLIEILNSFTKKIVINVSNNHWKLIFPTTWGFSFYKLVSRTIIIILSEVENFL